MSIFKKNSFILKQQSNNKSILSQDRFSKDTIIRNCLDNKGKSFSLCFSILSSRFTLDAKGFPFDDKMIFNGLNHRTEVLQGIQSEWIQKVSIIDPSLSVSFDYRDYEQHVKFINQEYERIDFAKVLVSENFSKNIYNTSIDFSNKVKSKHSELLDEIAKLIYEYSVSRLSYERFTFHISRAGIMCGSETTIVSFISLGMKPLEDICQSYGLALALENYLRKYYPSFIYGIEAEIHGSCDIYVSLLVGKNEKDKSSNLAEW